MKKKIENLKFLNRIVQKPDYKTKGNWMARYIVREVALPFTWFLLHTSITANQLTIGSIFIILWSAFAFSFGTIRSFFIGALLFELWYLVDHIDGQVARYRKQESVNGVFLDFLSHYFPNLFIFPFIAIGLFRSVNEIRYIYYGIIIGGMITMINLIFDCKYKSYFWGIAKYGLCKIAKQNKSSASRIKLSLSRSVFSWIYKFCEVHIVMNLLFLLGVLFLFKVIDFMFALKLLINGYFFLSIFIFIMKFGYYSISRKVEQDFWKIFEKP